MVPDEQRATNQFSAASRSMATSLNPSRSANASDDRTVSASTISLAVGDHRRGVELPDADRIGDRGYAAPTAHGTQRCRYFLEQIIQPCPLAARKAEALVEEFGSLGAAASGSRTRQLRALGGDAVAVARLRLFRTAMIHALRAPLTKRPLLSDWQRLLDYLRAEHAWLMIERVRILHLDAGNNLIRDEIVSEGTIDAAAFRTREIIARALELGSASLILVHNHPSGTLEPSRADIETTRRLVTVGKLFDISVHDHLIVSRDGHVSMRARGLI